MSDTNLSDIGSPSGQNQIMVYDTLDGGKGALDMYAGHQWCVYLFRKVERR